MNRENLKKANEINNQIEKLENQIERIENVSYMKVEFVPLDSHKSSLYRTFNKGVREHDFFGMNDFVDAYHKSLKLQLKQKIHELKILP